MEGLPQQDSRPHEGERTGEGGRPCLGDAPAAFLAPLPSPHGVSTLRGATATSKGTVYTVSPRWIWA